MLPSCCLAEHPRALSHLCRLYMMYQIICSRQVRAPDQCVVWKIPSQPLKHVAMMQDVENGQHLKCFLIG